MATQKVKPPDQDIRPRPDPGQRRRRTYWSIATYALVAFVLFVVAAGAVAVLRNEPTTDAVLAQSSEPGQTGTDEATDTATTKRHEPNPNFHWPPEGAMPALPEPGKHGELIMSETNLYGGNPQYLLRVFADGRVFWKRWYMGGPYLAGNGDNGSWQVRRLTPMGIGLVQRGVTADMAAKDPGCCSSTSAEWRRRHPFRDPFGLPEGAWKDPGPHWYRPARYGVCPSGSSDDTWLPLPRVRTILRGSEGGYHGRCVVVTAEDALRLHEIWAGTPRHEWRFVDVIPLLPNATLPSRTRRS